MELSFGRRITGLTADGAELKAAVFDENQVRAAAGLTMVLGAVAFSLAYFNAQYLLLQVVSTFFFIEFLSRLAFGISRSPVGVVARLMTHRRAPEWVSAKPKRFAWTLGLLPRAICAICLTLMWMESVLGVCLGCKVHALLVRRGWASADPEFEICAHGECAVAAPEDAVDRA